MKVQDLFEERFKFKDADWPDAEGRFVSDSAEQIANWLWRTREKNGKKQIKAMYGATNNFVNANSDNKKYAAKMQKVRDIIAKKAEKLTESDSDIADFHKKLKDQVTSHAQATAAIAKQHKWKFSIGDVFMSTKTQKTYELKNRSFQKRIDRDENFKKVGEAYLAPVYWYETSDGEKGQFWEDDLAKSKTLKRIAKAGDKVD